MFRTLTVLSSLSLLLSASFALGSDLDRVQGTWLTTIQGMNVTFQVKGSDAKMTIAGEGGSMSTEGSLLWNETVTPKAVDFVGFGSPNPAHGIYELSPDGNQLTLCVANNGAPRPSTFAHCGETDATTLTVLKRPQR